jgi:hypothetical protein
MKINFSLTKKRDKNYFGLFSSFKYFNKKVGCAALILTYKLSFEKINNKNQKTKNKNKY